ncbi:MAG: hypothetical protein INR73_01770 [Williamsia sp.]|nr:hypothetical protein [Williamsia sp.]
MKLKTLKTLVTLTVLAGMFASCRKSQHPEPTIPSQPSPPASVTYLNFNNKEVRFNGSFGADLDNDGEKDFFVYTLLVGDPLLKADYRQFLFGTSLSAELPISESEEVPMMEKGAPISANLFTGYNWYNVASIIMAKKVITMAETHWEGKWKTAAHRFLPLRINSKGKNYYGWVEVSFSTHDEKVTLHGAALSTMPETGLVTGQIAD